MEFSLDNIQKWVETEILNAETGLQLAWIALAIAMGFLLSRMVGRKFNAALSHDENGKAWLAPIRYGIRDSIFPFITLILLLLFGTIAADFGLPTKISSAAVSLALAWIVIRLAIMFIRSRSLARFITVIAWTIAALNILGLLDRLLALMDELAINMGETRLSLLTIIKGVIILAVLLWAASALSRLIERQLKGINHLAPSLQVLFSKLIYIVLLVFAFLIGLNTIGIDLTALAVFSGALGVGIGFGLQKVVSNFISGIILLMDRSIKPGDVIAIGETYGWVNTLGARHVSVITRDGKEHLIPNELLITEKVENWSYTNRNIRLRIPLGVSYNEDIHKVIELVQDASRDNKRVLSTPAPRCLLRGFGDNSVDLELRVWINDPANGIANITSEIMLGIWDAFQEANVEIPFPQRDLHLVSVDEKAGRRLSGTAKAASSS